MRPTPLERTEKGRLLKGEYGSPPGDRNGAFEVVCPITTTKLRIIACDGNGEFPWEHVSVSTPHRTPNWHEMCWVKEQFWDDEECVIQYHPPKSTYVNNHPHCLHLWRPTNQIMPIPMPPEILVGIKDAGELKDRKEAETVKKKYLR